MRQASSRTASFFLILFGIAGLTACVSTPPQDRVTIRYYTVEGDTLAAIERNIAKHGPKGGGRNHNIAVTRFRFAENLDFQKNPNGCIVRRANFGFSATMILPRLKSDTGLSQTTQDRWEKVASYIKKHEQTHVKIARNHLNQLEKEILQLPASRQCSSLRTNVKLLKRAALARLDAAHIRYDQNENARFAQLQKNED